MGVVNWLEIRLESEYRSSSIWPRNGRALRMIHSMQVAQLNTGYWKVAVMSNMELAAKREESRHVGLLIMGRFTILIPKSKSPK